MPKQAEKSRGTEPFNGILSTSRNQNPTKMKNALSLMILLCSTAISCTEDKTTIDVQSPNAFTGLNREQMNALSMSSINKYVLTDKQYVSVSNDLIKSISSSTFVNHNTYGRQKSLDYGAVIQILTKDERQAQMIRIGGNGINEDYFIQIDEDKKFFLSLKNGDGNPKDGRTKSEQPVYQYELFDMAGNMISSSDQSTGRTNSWASCFMAEFDSLCGGALSGLICEAATLACPECMAVVLVAIAISCIQY
jgi:hypothetical protein